MIGIDANDALRSNCIHETQTHDEHILPSGCAQWLFALHAATIVWRSSASQCWTSWAGSIRHGPQSSFYIAGPKPVGVTVGIAFHPGSAAAIVGASMAELAARRVPSDLLPAARGVELHDRLLSTTGPAKAFSLLEAHLCAVGNFAHSRGWCHLGTDPSALIDLCIIGRCPGGRGKK